MAYKIEYRGFPYSQREDFYYYSKPHYIIDYVHESGISFYYQFRKNVFLRIQVGNSMYQHYAFAAKLAALSDFYEVLSEEFGEPTVFFTTKDDNGDLLSMHWSFINKEEDIQKFKKGTYFDDVVIDKLIIIGESKQETDGYQLSDVTKKLISKQIGLPFELLPLVEK